MLRSELNRAFYNKSFAIVVLVTAGTIIFGFSDSWVFYQKAQANPQLGYHPYYFNAFETFLFALTLSPFLYIASLSATIPYADSLVADRESGYMRYAICRAGYWRFLLSKLVANWLVGAMTVAMSMALAFGTACLLFPMHLPPLYVEGVKASIMGIPHTPLNYIFETSPGLYILWRIGLGFLFGGAYATLGFAISSVVRNRYIVLAGPFIAFLVASLLIDLLGFFGWVPPVALAPEININSSAMTMLINYVVIYGVSLAFVFVKFSQNWVIDGQKEA